MHAQYAGGNWVTQIFAKVLTVFRHFQPNWTINELLIDRFKLTFRSHSRIKAYTLYYRLDRISTFEFSWKVYLVFKVFVVKLMQEQFFLHGTRLFNPRSPTCSNDDYSIGTFFILVDKKRIKSVKILLSY